MNPPGTTPALDELLPALGTTGGGSAALGLLVTHQRRRRLLTLRALLDAVRTAPAGTLPDGAADRLLRDWRLLTAADRADPAAARRVLHYPLTGAWAERCVRALSRAGQAPRAAAALPHLAALAVSAAARAGLRFSAEVPVRDGAVTLPTLGDYRPPTPWPAGTEPRARADGDGSRLWLHLDPEHPAAVDGTAGAPYRRWQERGYEPAGRRPGGPRTVEVRRGPDGVWRSAAAGWRPLPALWTDAGRPVLIDTADPYRDEEHRTNPYGLTVNTGLAPAEHARWRTAWRDAQPWLRLGGGTRAGEVDTMLDCFVPLTGAGAGAVRCSATRAEAFGALLSSTPRGGLDLAATLVHELQHTKLLALSEVTELHTADETASYFAPWRPDPRPFDGLFQGAYAHLALADFHLGVARTVTEPAGRDAAWAAHCRCRQQVEAALPQLLGSSRLTRRGRTLVNAMAAHHTRLKEQSPPDGHLARATAYVETARVIWRRRRT